MTTSFTTELFQICHVTAALGFDSDVPMPRSVTLGLLVSVTTDAVKKILRNIP